MARRRDLSVGGAPIAVLEAGPDTGTRVLLVPGYTGSKEDFHPLLDPLASAGYRAVAMDQRGQFESPGPADPAAYTVAALARDALAVADHLGDPVHLVGHSFGGLVARAAAVAEPARLRSVVLMGSGPGALPAPRLAPYLAFGAKDAAAAMGDLYERVEAFAAGDPAWRESPPELKAFLKKRFLASSPAGLLGMRDALVTEPDRVADLRATGLPVLVVYGEADDAWPPAVLARMADRLGARHVAIPGSVHQPAVENPAATVRALLEFFVTCGT